MLDFKDIGLHKIKSVGTHKKQVQP